MNTELRSKLAEFLYYVHEHCRIPGFYDGDGEITYLDGTTEKRVGWELLSAVDCRPERVDQRYFERAADHILSRLEPLHSSRSTAPAAEIEFIAVLLSNVHGYYAYDESDTFWQSLEVSAVKTDEVDKTFFRRLAIHILQECGMQVQVG